MRNLARTDNRSIAFVALPVVLLTIDVHLSSSDTQRQRRRRRLEFYTTAIKAYRVRFDYAEVILAIIQKVLRLTNLPSVTVSLSDVDTPEPMRLSHGPKGWRDILAGNPQLYFRLVTALDYSMSQGMHRCDQTSSKPALLYQPPQSRDVNEIEDRTLTKTPEGLANPAPKDDPLKCTTLRLGVLESPSPDGSTARSDASPNLALDFFAGYDLFVESDFLGFQGNLVDCHSDNFEATS